MPSTACGVTVLRYVSTRGEAPVLGFSEVLLAGLARDGGLYVPETVQTLTPDAIRDLRGLPHAEVATRVMLPFLGGELAAEDCGAVGADAIGGSGPRDVTPLRRPAHTTGSRERVPT